MVDRGFVYILANGRYGTLYVGATSDLERRVEQHRSGAVGGFTRTHRLTRLVWYEVHDELESALIRERQIKRWHRNWKVNLVQAMNPEWDDLYGGLVGH